MAPEYRVPWIIRSVVSGIVSDPKYSNEDMMAGLPPLLGTDLLRETRERFQDDEEVRHWFNALAGAVLMETEDSKRQASRICADLLSSSENENGATRS
jgi:hypothetical protein